VDPAQKDKIALAYVELASAKPEPPRRFGPPPAADQKQPPEAAPPDKK
jgi:hypothetical protein